MKLIRHRRNTLQELAETSHEYGIEVDIRSQGERLIMHHDAFVDGESFDDWVATYQHGTLILNVKEEGLEARLISLMAKHGIEDYFFLDQSFPFMMKYAAAAKGRCAVRVSEFESIETAMTLAGRVSWVWVDCFTRFPLTKEAAELLKNGGFKLCIVSPELQQRDAETEIPQMRALMDSLSISPEAVCTKRPDLWTLPLDGK